MGTNFYLRRTKPRMVYDEFHLGKRSGGWEMHFQDSDGLSHYRDTVLPDAEEFPEYHSVEDIRELLESEEYQIVDEYGTSWNPGEESLDVLQKLVDWSEGKQYPGSRYISNCHDHRDEDGNWFTSVPFR
jgi:hypothetical protein